jgi:hypothetical protein
VLDLSVHQQSVVGKRPYRGVHASRDRRHTGVVEMKVTLGARELRAPSAQSVVALWHLDSQRWLWISNYDLDLLGFAMLPDVGPRLQCACGP